MGAYNLEETSTIKFDLDGTLPNCQKHKNDCRGLLNSQQGPIRFEFGTTLNGKNINGCGGGRVVAQADGGKKREEIAYSFLDSNLERAKLLHQALDRKAKPPEGLDLYLFTGDFPLWHNT